MRGKRRSRGTWFPILGTRAADIPAIDDDSLTFELAVDAPVDGSAGLGIIPITYDFPQEGPALQVEVDTLSEIVGNEYICKRILGSCFVANSGGYDSTNDQGPNALLVTCGFFVARAGADSQGPLGAAGPIGYGTDTVQSDLEQYSPGNPATAREPWMWRRTWVLGNPRKAWVYGTSPSSAGSELALPYGYAPPTNAGYGTLRSGPDVDIKSRRRVKLDERLFFATEVRTLPLGTSTDQALGVAGVYVALTIRLFGSLVKARGSGAF